MSDTVAPGIQAGSTIGLVNEHGKLLRRGRVLRVGNGHIVFMCDRESPCPYCAPRRPTRPAGQLNHVWTEPHVIRARTPGIKVEVLRPA